MNLAVMFAAAAEEHDSTQTHHWLLPEDYEMYWGIPASILIFALLIWKAGPVIKKGFNDRTARVQAQLDDAANDLSAAEAEAAEIRRALGDVEAERARMLTDADAQAEALLRDGRAWLDTEVADLEARATADVGRRPGAADFPGDRPPLGGRRRACGQRAADRGSPPRPDRVVHPEGRCRA